MNVNMEFLYADRYKPVEGQIEKQKLIYKDNPAIDVPILRERLHYSFIWDRYPLVGPEDIDLREIHIFEGKKQRTVK